MIYDNQKLTGDFDENALEDFLDDDLDEASSDIRSSSTIHDRFQFETKFDFELSQNKENNKKKQYNVDVYFFIPKSIGINSDTYTRENFYSDLTNYLRIRTPDMFSSENQNFKEWSLPWSDKYFACHLSTQKRQKLNSVVTYEVRMFGCFVNTQLKRFQSTFLNLMRKKSNSLFSNNRYLKILELRLKKIEDIVNRYRYKYILPIRQEKVLMENEVKRAFLIVDEFISYRLEFILIKVKQLLENKNNCYMLNDFIENLLRNEINYRKDTNLVTLEAEKDTYAYETYHYRVGLLKKYVLEVLYLQSENIKQEKVYRNLIAAFGASLAAFWAAITDIQRLNMMNNAKDNGFRLIVVIMVGVLAYVFKDRIKELSKEYFNQKLKHFIPDFDRKMFYKYFNLDGEEKKEFLGVSREFMRYLNKESLPEEINYIRNIGSVSALDPDRKEVIINYSKKISFKNNGIKDSINKINFIRDLSRFDISEFLAKLSDPDKVLRYFDNTKGIVSIEAPKVYHINLIIKYTTTQEKKSVVELERSRIILNKKGILRIDKVIERGQIKYEEEK